MAEAWSKRQREDSEIEEDSKRHRSYNHILSLLDDEEEEPNQDLSSIITTLQQELSSDDSSSVSDPPPSLTAEIDPENYLTASEDSSSSSGPSSSAEILKDDEEDEKERVMRHLLEASDDELGIPTSEFEVNDGVVRFNGGDSFPLCDALWELEDEAANYYTLLQSELFM